MSLRLLRYLLLTILPVPINPWQTVQHSHSTLGWTPWLPPYLRGPSIPIAASLARGSVQLIFSSAGAPKSQGILPTAQLRARWAKNPLHYAVQSVTSISVHGSPNKRRKQMLWLRRSSGFLPSLVTGWRPLRSFRFRILSEPACNVENSVTWSCSHRAP